MLIIRELEKKDTSMISSLALLHEAAFPSFFLTQLGIPFLRTLYNGYLEDLDSGIIVAEEDNAIVGFIAYSNDYPKFYKSLVKHHIVKFALCSLKAAIRHPSYIKRLFGALKKSESVVKNEKYVELASICVEPTNNKRGIGSALIDYLKRIVDFDEYAYINLETDAVDNDSVNRFYKNNGFHLVRVFTTSEGRIMNEYRFKGDNSKYAY